ncbi:uncharacterized protein LOC110700891 [Chenopodium quinoa]|uniref:uncharacterized protein LOC110700891 n=1 Tax=Chenopodium quinoa TaxID=63459 RepID=UPI000B78AFE9|nr:uncharacterized protein LOC110700891 [Chenopodium quinoa]
MNAREKLEEGYSTQRPPMFNGKFYSYWKNRMEIFIKAENYQVWRVIENGDFELTKTNANKEVIPKPLAEFDKEDYEKYELNAQAVKILHCGLGPHELNRIMGCKSAKQIWDLLQDMFTRFTNIVNELESLGRSIPIDEQVRKVLRSLPQDERWRYKVTALQESKDFPKFNLEQFNGSLLTHELHLGANSESSKNKSLALKAYESSDSENDDVETAMLVRRFRRMLGKRGEKNRRGQPSSKDFKCYRCGSEEHLLRYCPNPKEDEKANYKGKEQNKYYKSSFSKEDVRKSMMAAWGNSDSEDEGEGESIEETANLCLMAKANNEARLKELESEVWYDYRQLKHLNKENLMDIILELQEDCKELNRSKFQTDQALKIHKEHSEWVDNMKDDVQNRLFDLYDKNVLLKEQVEKLKHDNILLNVELAQLKLGIDFPDTEVPIANQLPNFEKLKSDLEEVKIKNQTLEEELARARKGKEVINNGIPSWIANAPNKNKGGLGYKKKSRRNRKYVDLPSQKLCHYCCGTGHLRATCPKKFKILLIILSMLNRIINNDTNNIILEGTRKGNTYIVDLNEVPRSSLTCLSVIENDPLLWHKRFGHASFSLLDKLRSKELVEGLPSIKFLKDKVCSACVKGKQTRISFKYKNMVSTTKLLELIHMDLCGPMRIQSRSGKRYVMVIVDDFSRYTWVFFLVSKDDTFDQFVAFVKKEQRRTGHQLVHLRSNHGTDFENSKFDEFCEEHGMDHNFSASKTPQQNGVVERKNRSLEDMERTMLISSGLPRNFWAEAVNTACYILNKVSIRAITNKTPYELMKGRKPNISYFRSFGCRCFVHNNGKRNLGKFDERSDEAVFLGYASNSKAYRVYNKRTMCVDESVHIIFDETDYVIDVQDDDDDFEIGLVRRHDPDEESTASMKQQDKNPTAENQTATKTEVPQEEHLEPDNPESENPKPLNQETEDNGAEPERLYPIKDFTPKRWKHQKSHPMDMIMSDITKGTQTRSQLRNFCAFYSFLSTMEPKNCDEAL